MEKILERFLEWVHCKLTKPTKEEKEWEQFWDSIEKAIEDSVK
jgi:hypothetical protein